MCILGIDRSTDVLWFLPDVVMLATSVTMYFVLHRLNKHAEYVAPKTTTKLADVYRRSFIRRIGHIAVVVALLAAAAVHPSLISIGYFLSFLVISTSWACLQGMSRVIRVICRLSMLLLSAQIVFVVLHANDWPTNLLHPNSMIDRMIGLKEIVEITCSPGTLAKLSFRLKPGISAIAFINPIVLMSSYFIIAVVENYLRAHRRFFKKMVPTVVVHPADAHNSKFNCITCIIL